MNDKKREEMRLRTKRFALAIIRFYGSLPDRTIAQVLGRQVLRSGASVRSHYREACRAKSNADFVSKLEGGLQELDETACWLELLRDAAIAKINRVEPLLAEANELIAIFVTVVRSVKGLPKAR